MPDENLEPGSEETKPQNLGLAFRFMKNTLAAKKVVDATLRKPTGTESPRHWCGICGVTHTPNTMIGDHSITCKNCPKCQDMLDQGFLAIHTEKPTPNHPTRYVFLKCESLVNVQGKTQEERQVITVSPEVMELLVERFQAQADASGGGPPENN